MTEIREALNGAFDKSSPDTPPPESGTPIEALGTDDTPPPGELPASEAPAAAATPARGATGKFTKPGQAPSVPTLAPTAPAAASTSPAETPAATAATPPTPTVKAPQSWRPEVREKWAVLPPEVQQEVARREREVATALQETAGARRTAEAFTRLVEPYRALMTDEPIKVVGGLLQTFAALRTAPPAHKAQLVARLIQDYQIPVDALASALDGQPASQQPGQPPAAPALDPETLLSQAEQRVMQRIQAQTQKAMAEKARRETEAFVASGKAEFFDDVRDLMANALDIAARSGVALTLQEAYDRACVLHPEVSKVLEQRKLSTAATANNAATQRAKAAASSVRSQPAAAPAAPAPDDIRSQLEASISRLSGR